MDGVDLAIPAGQFVAVVGSSGSGKTTLVKMINRLIEPDAGDVRVGGEAISGQAVAEFRRRIGYVFQGIGLFPHLTVAENIALVPSLLGWPKAKMAGRTAELLALVDLPEDYAARFPDALSGGQRQRVGVARALAAGPKIMLMDEPFGALDPVTRDSLGHRLSQAARRARPDHRDGHPRRAGGGAARRPDRGDAQGPPARRRRPRRPVEGPRPDEVVEALMSTPRRQAERVRALIDGPAEGGAA